MRAAYALHKGLLSYESRLYSDRALSADAPSIVVVLMGPGYFPYSAGVATLGSPPSAYAQYVNRACA
jgi:hypothetical protein